MSSEIIILKVGGSILSKSDENFFDYDYAFKLKEMVQKFSDKKFILISGGGSLAKKYIRFLKEHGATNRDLDWVGIYSNNLNAQTLRIVFSEITDEDILINEEILEEKPINLSKQVLIAGGSIPGQSGDSVAVTLALRANSKKVFILKNVDGVYSDDPNENPAATKFDNLSWNEYKEIVGEMEFKPKLALPIDPIATKLCIENNLEVVILDGENLANLEKAIKGESFVGTTIK